MQLDDKKAIFGWSMYDWANSAFATTIMAGFFPIVFKQFWSVGVDTTVSTARLGLANSIGGITVALSAPILGAIADKGTAKKRFLLFFAYMGTVMTTSLYIVSKGNWPVAIMLYVFATVGFSGGNIFYDALITGVSSEKNMDFVSALGFSMDDPQPWNIWIRGRWTSGKVLISLRGGLVGGFFDSPFTLCERACD